MTDIRSLGPRGQAVFDTATKIKDAGLIDQARFDQLTDTNVNNDDVTVGREALDKLQKENPNAVSLAIGIGLMNNNVTVLQRESLQRNRAALAEAQQGRPPESRTPTADDVMRVIDGAAGVRNR